MLFSHVSSTNVQLSFNIISSDSSFHFSHEIWGGNKKANFSEIWSISEKKWTSGPTYPNELYVMNSCSLALNSSSVLIIGLIWVTDSTQLHLSPNYGVFPNDKTYIYNFDLQLWSEQDPLFFSWNTNFAFDYEYDPACQVIHEKNESRYDFFIKIQKNF